MSPSLPANPRETSLKVALWLVERGRVDDAVAILAAWAANGENDPQGQKLLAEALRIKGDSPVAKAAFQYMEGVAGVEPVLAAAVQKWTVEELGKLEAEIARPRFLKAQVGFNNNLKYKGHEYHVQTEDSGLQRPHIITHLFADGGRVIKSFKRSYAEHVSREDVVPFVRAWMKGQHMEMVLALRDEKFDGIIAGTERGGMDLLTEAPQVDLKKVNKKDVDQGKGVIFKVAGAPAGAPAAAPVAAPTPAAPTPSRPRIEAAPVSQAPPKVLRFVLHVIRAIGGTVDRYEAPGDDVVLGAKDGIELAHEKFCHPTEAVFHFRGGELTIEDLDGGNGVFIRIVSPVEIEVGDEFVVGDQLLRVIKPPPRDDSPGEGPTYFWASPHHAHTFRVQQILEGGRLGACMVGSGTTLTIGRETGDMNFPSDPFVNDPHCYVEEQAGAIVLADLESKHGVFVRIRGEQKLSTGDEILVGRTRLRVEIKP